MVELAPSQDQAPPVDDGYSAAFTVTTPRPQADIRVDQLHQELCQAHGWPPEAITAVEIMGGGGIEGAILHVISDTVLDLTKTAQVARAHKPKADFTHPSPPTAAGVDQRRKDKGLPARPAVVPVNPSKRPTTP